MYKNILVPIALDHESDIAKSLAIARNLLADGGQITLLSVIEDVPSYVSEYVMVKQVDKVIEGAKAKLKADFADKEGVNSDVISGHAGVVITKYAEKNNMDLIVVSSRRPGVHDYFLGSTAARLVRRAPCAVHVVR